MFFKAKSTTNLVTYLDFISPLVSSQRQIVSLLTLAVHMTLSGILFCFTTSDGFVNWFRRCLNNRQSSARILHTFSSPFEVISGVPQGCVSSPLRFIIFIKDLFNAIKHSKYVLFGDDVRIFRAVNSVDGCVLLQSNTERMKGWFSASFMKLNIIKIGYCFY